MIKGLKEKKHIFFFKTLFKKSKFVNNEIKVIALNNLQVYLSLSTNNNYYYMNNVTLNNYNNLHSLSIFTQ